MFGYLKKFEKIKTSIIIPPPTKFVIYFMFNYGHVSSVIISTYISASVVANSVQDNHSSSGLGLAYQSENCTP